MVYKIIFVQKQSSGGVLQERCSANMNQIHMRTTMQKHDLNKFPLQLYWNRTHAHISPQIFAAYLQNTLLRESTSRGLLLHVERILKDLIINSFYLQFCSSKV